MLLALMLCLAEPPAPPERPAYEQMSVQDLRAERANVEANRPSLLGPIFMMVSGGILMGTGGFFGLFAAAGLFGGPTFGNVMVFAGLLLGGGGFLTGGILYMRVTRAERSHSDDDLNLIDEQLDLRRRQLGSQRMPTVTVASF